MKVGTDQNLDQMVKIARFAAMRGDSVSSIRDQSGVHEKSTISMTSQLSNYTTTSRGELCPLYYVSHVNCLDMCFENHITHASQVKLSQIDLGVFLEA